MTAKISRYMQNLTDGLSKYEAAIKAGFSESAAKSTSHIEKTEAFQRLKDEFIPKSMLYKKMQEGFEATKPIQHDQELIDYPDYSTRHKYLDTALKIHGEYSPDKIDATVTGSIEHYFTLKKI